MDQELLETLKLALENEIAGEEIYTKISNSAKDDFTKKTFKFLAKDEIYHIEKIKEFLNTKKAAEIEENIRNRNPKQALKFFELTEKEFKNKKQTFKGELSPYKLAIEMEIKSKALYQDLLTKAKEPKLIQFLKFLIKEEQTHKTILEQALKFFQSPEDYFLETEKWSFD